MDDFKYLHLKNGTLTEDYNTSRRLKVWASRVLGAMYQWPTMQKDAQSYVKAYDKCQCFSKTSWLNTTKESRRAPNPHPNRMDRQPRLSMIKDANDTGFSSKAKSYYLRVEGRTKPPTSALVQHLSPTTYGWNDEPSHSQEPWSKCWVFQPTGGWTNQVIHECLGTKFKSYYLWVEGRTESLTSALVKILSLPTYGWKDEPSHQQVPWYKI